MLSFLIPLENLPKTYATPEIDIEFNGNSHFKFIEEFIKLSKFDEYDVSLIDGIKISNDESWGLIRASSNKPSLVIVTESPTSDDRKLKIFRFIDSLLQKTGKIGEYDQKI